MNAAGPFALERAPLLGATEGAEVDEVAGVADELGAVEVGEAPLPVELPGAPETVPEAETETVDKDTEAADIVVGKIVDAKFDVVMGPGPRLSNKDEQDHSFPFSTLANWQTTYDGLLTIEKLPLLLMLPCARTLPDIMARMKKT